MYMKYLGLIVYISFLFSSCASKAPEGKKNYLSFPDNEALYDFYRYREHMPVLVQGHRGTIENRLPESCIAAFEYVLERIPAVFEIDPRLTKDSVIVVFHDNTLERTTNGQGEVKDHTWAELQQLRLKNAHGELTDHRIPTLAEVLQWAREKTILILDKKDVPLQMIADIIRAYDANHYVINMVRSPEDARFYYDDNPERMFSVSIRKPEVFDAYMQAGIPKTQMFACIGTEINEDTEALCKLMKENGIRCLMATASSYDKIDHPEERAEAYRRIVEAGVTIIESNYPLELNKALAVTHN